MARLGSENNVTESLVILSSDEEDEGDSNKSDVYPNHNEYTGIPSDFMCVIKKLREKLREEKDDRRCNILGLMYRKASKTLTSSEGFKSFIKDMMGEIERDKDDRANLLLLLTAVCQTLAVGEIMWSPANPDRSKTKQSSRDALQKQTRKQCIAVKALLFNDSPPPAPTEITKTKDKIEKKSGEPTEAAKNKDKVEKKSGRSARQCVSNKSKNKNASKGSVTITDSTEVTKSNEKSEKKPGKGGKWSTNSKNSKNKDDSKSPSPPLIPDPFITDLSSEASSILHVGIMPSPKNQNLPNNDLLPPTATSNVIVLGDFDVDTIDNEEVENPITFNNNTGKKIRMILPKPELEKSSNSTSTNDSAKKSKLSLMDVVSDLARGKSSPKLLPKPELGKSSSSTSINDSGKKSKLTLMDVVSDLSKDKSSNMEETDKSSLSLPIKEVEKTPGIKQTKKRDKSLTATVKEHDEPRTPKPRKEKEKSPLTSPILSPFCRRTQFLKAVEKVKKDTKADQKPLEDDDDAYRPLGKSTEKKTAASIAKENSGNLKKIIKVIAPSAEKTKTSAKKKKKGERKRAKGSKPSSEGSSADDEVTFISEKHPTLQTPQNTIVLASNDITVPNQVHKRNIPWRSPDLNASMPWKNPENANSPGASLLDMCYVYEIQPSGAKLPSSLVNNKNLQSNLQSSALSSRETSPYLTKGAEGISVVTPNKTYTTTLNVHGKPQVDLTASRENSNKNNAYRTNENSTEYILGIDGSFMESVQGIDQVEKRKYPSENCNPDCVELIPDDVCDSTPVISPDSSTFPVHPGRRTPNTPSKKSVLPGRNSPAVKNNSSSNNWIVASDNTVSCDVRPSSERSAMDMNTTLSRKKSASPKIAKVTGNKNVAKISTKSAKTAKTDVTVISDSNESSDNDDTPQDISHKQTKDHGSISIIGRSDDVTKEKSPSESSGDEVIFDSVLHEEDSRACGKEKSSSLVINKDSVTISDKSLGTLDDAKAETPSESSGDEVTVVSDPNTSGEEGSKCNNEKTSSPKLNDSKMISNNASDRSDVTTAVKSPSDSSGDEVTVLSDSETAQEEKRESDEGSSTVPNVSSKETVEITEEEKINECEGTSNSKSGELKASSVTVDSDFYPSNAENDDGDNELLLLPPVPDISKPPSESDMLAVFSDSSVILGNVSPESTESSKTTKSSGRKSIQDIANKLKQRLEKNDDHEVKISDSIDDSTILPVTSHMEKETIALCSWAKPKVSFIDSPSAKLSKLNACNASNLSIGTRHETINEKSSNEVILIGDDSDDEEPVSSEKTSVSGKRSAFSIKPADSCEPSAAVSSKPPVSTSKPSAVSSKTTVSSKLSTVSKKTSTSSSKTVTVGNKTTILSSKLSASSNKQSAKKKSLSTDKPTTNTPTYVSGILSNKSSDTDKPCSSTILSKTSERIKQSSNSKKTALITESDETTVSASAQEKETVKVISKKGKIRQLESILERLERKINRFARQEITFKDMTSEESAYLQEARAKERYIANWRLYCKLTGEDADFVVSSRKKVKVSSSPFPQLNAAVEKYINKSEIFPNLFEVKQVCVQANNKYNLDLKPTDLHHCAVDIFSEVGRKLQKRREKDFRTTSGNSLTDEVNIEEDPARNDANLKRKLKQNRKIAKQRTDDVFKDFVRQQYEQTTGDIDKSNDSDSEPHISDSEHRLAVSDTDTQTSDSDGENSESDTQDSDNDISLEQLRKKKLIINKNTKRSLADKNAGKPVVKKKRVDKTIISLTLSSSQEIAETSGNKKIDYQVTIGSSSPKVKSIQNKNNTETRTKSPATLQHTVQSHQQKQLHKLTQKQRTQKLSLLQFKSKPFKGNKPNSKKQLLSTEVSTESSGTVKQKDKLKFSNVKSSESSTSGKRKRISMLNDKYDNDAVASNYEGFRTSETDSKKQKNDSNVFDKPFTIKKVRPSLLPEKPVLGTGDKNTSVSVEYSPLSAFRKTKADENIPKGKEDASENKESLAKSKQQGETIVLDD